MLCIQIVRTFAVDLWRFAKLRFCGGYARLCRISKDYTVLPQAHPRKLLHSGRHVLSAQCSVLARSALSLLVILLLSPDFSLLYTFKRKEKRTCQLELAGLPIIIVRRAPPLYPRRSEPLSRSLCVSAIEGGWSLFP